MDADRSVGRVVKAIGRRSNLIVAAALVATIVAAAASILRPKSYSAETHVEVGAVGGLNGEGFVARVQSTDERLLSREALAEVAKKVGLDESRSAALGERTTVELTQPSGSNYGVVISHRADDPDFAVKVAAAFAECYQRLASDDSAAQQQKTVEDLGKIEAEAKAALDKVAAERAAYVKENREFLEGAREKLQATRARKAQLQQVIDDIKQQKKEFGELIAKEKPSLVVKTKDADGVEKESRVPNEQWTKLDDALRAAESRLNGANLEMRQANAQEKELEELAKRTPEHEAKATELADAEAATRKTYETKAQALLAAETSLADMRARGALAVRSVEAPTRPTRPAGPGALAFAFAGLLLGAAAGVGTVVAKAATDRSFHQAELVADILGVPSMGAVGVIQTTSEVGAEKTLRRRRFAMLCALGVAAVIAVAFAASGAGDAVGSIFSSAAG
jgi:uncharacterized protein involved in exopolysaccharide biosynthesis